ncbi:MAG: TraI domain-containing protein [Pseudomonadales bacterium]|nr:TraI domain-containing protein [Pseudomonadales bacterium]
MLRKWLRRNKTPNIPGTSENSDTKYPIVTSGKVLLEVPSRTSLVLKIKRSFSITEDVWENHYLYAIEEFAELVQGVPASEIHHHSEEGGLIDHTLEALHAGVRIAQGYMLPPNAEPEDIATGADRWRFGAFIAILAHDIGKVVTDIEVVYREGKGDFQKWHPWYGNLPMGAEYTYRYKHRANNSKVAKSIHEKAAMSLLPRLLTKKAAQWMFEDTELLAQLFSTVTHSTFGGQAIAEIVRTADSASVGRNLGVNTGVKTDHSYAVPLHEKLMVSLRKLINDGELKKNKPGAAIWVTESETWVVSKTTMEAVRAQLINEGHTGLPKNVVRLFEVLRDHELLIKNDEGESVWTAEVNDFAKNWQQKLTFLRFKNELIWPTSNPDKFDGTLTPVDLKGNPLVESLESAAGVQDETPDESVPPSSTDDRAPKEVSKQQYTPPSNTSAKVPLQKNTQVSQGNARIEAVKPINAADSNEPQIVTSSEAKELWKYSRKVQENILSDNDFIAWLLRGIERRKIRVNEAKAPVHILDNHVALVTPAIFIQYLDNNSLKKRIYEKRAGDKKVFTLLQSELEALDIHQRSTQGQNIVKLVVKGQRRQGELRVYLLNRACFPSLNNFSPNNAIKIKL